MGITPPPFQGSLSGQIEDGVHNLTGEIDALELPFEDQLKKYVEAEEAFDISTLISQMSDLLDNLHDLTASMATYLLEPSRYEEEYTTELLTNLTEIVDDNLSAGGTGLPEEVEDAMYARQRERNVAAANRAVRKATVEIGKRLPYSGAVAEAMADANRAAVAADLDVSRNITIDQGKRAWEQQRAVISEAAQTEQIKIGSHHQTKNRDLNAYSTYDEHHIRNHWQYYDWLIRRVVGCLPAAVDFMYKSARGEDQMTFENWLSMSKLMADGQLQISALTSELVSR